jgi:hypothetical protein
MIRILKNLLVDEECPSSIDPTPNKDKETNNDMPLAATINSCLGNVDYLTAAHS